MAQPQWPVGMLWFDEDEGTDRQIPVVPLKVARALADALGASMEGDQSESDKALALYERTVG